MVAPDKHIAQFNFARLKYPIDDPRSAGFVDGSAVINRIAERSAGFASVFTSSGVAGTLKQPIWNDPLIAVNISVWATLSTLENFVYNTLHKTYLARRESWFEDIEGPTMVLWWVDPGHEPSLDEALDRLASLKTEGANARTFDWAYARAHFMA